MMKIRYLHKLVLSGVVLGCLVCIGASLAGAALYPEEVASDKPIAYWRFEKDLKDSIGGITLQPSVAPEFVDGPGTGTKAFSTKGGNAWAAALKTVKLFDIQSFTYEMWINPAGLNTETYLLMRRTGTSTGTAGENSLVYNYTAGRVEFQSSHNEFDPRPGFDLTDNTNAWHHVVFVYDDATMEMIVYLDGKEVDRQPGAINYLNTGHDEEIYIGATRTAIGEHIFNGYIDEVAIYTSALTAAQVTAHYQAAFPTNYPAAVKADKPTVYWRFETNFKDEMGEYDLIPSGMSFVTGPGVASNTAMTGRVSSMEAENVYGLFSFTYEFWFNTINKSVKSYIIFRRAGGTQQAVIYGYNTDRLEYFSEFDPTRPGVVVPNGVDKWHHAAFVYDDSVPQMRVYLNGELVDTRDGQANAGSSGNEIHLNGSDQGDNYNGYLDELAIYDAALPEARIKAHFNTPFAVDVSGWSLY